MEVITQTRTRKARGQGATRREEILDAAKRLFVEQGVQHVTMRKIANAVGVSATAIYVYFPDKDAIMEAIADHSFQALRAAHASAVHPDKSAAQNLRAGLRAYVAFAKAHPDEYRLVFLRTGRRDEPDLCAQGKPVDCGFILLIQSVEAMIGAGLFPPKPPMLMAEAIWACLHGVVTLMLTNPEAIESDPDALATQVIDMAIRGLCRPDKTDPC